MKQPDLGKKIAELRQQKNLTQDDLVEKPMHTMLPQYGIRCSWSKSCSKTGCHTSWMVRHITEYIQEELRRTVKRLTKRLPAFLLD